MIDEIVFNLIKNGEWLKIVLILISYFINWFIQLGLGYYFLTYKFEAKDIAFFSFFAMLVSIVARAVLTNPIYLVFYLIIYVMLLKMLTRERLIFVAFASVFLYFLSCLSFVLIAQPLLLTNQEIKAVLMNRYEGIVIGSIIESSMAGIILLVLLKFKIKLGPAVKNLTKSDIWAFISFSCIAYYLGSSLVVCWNEINKSDNPIISVNSIINVVVAMLAFISFFAVRALVTMQRNDTANDYKKTINELTLSYERKIDDSFGKVYQQTTDTMRGCLLTISEVLKKHEDNLEVAIDKIGDIVSENIGYNPVLKYILMTKRLSFISEKVTFNIRGNFELVDYYDLDFWTLFSQSLDIITRAYISNYGNPTSTFANLFQLNYMNVAIDEYPNAITFTVDSPKQPDHIYESSEFIEHHVSENEKDICNSIMHPNVKRFSYGTFEGKVMRIQVTYEKEQIAINELTGATGSAAGVGLQTT